MKFDPMYLPENNSQVKEAVEAFRTMRERGESKWYEMEELLDMIEQTLTFSGDEELALEIIEYGLLLHPDNLDLIVTKSRIFLDRGEAEEAEAIASTIRERTHLQARLLFAEIYISTRRVKEARSMLDAILERDTLDEEDYMDVANIYYNADLIDWGIECLQKGVERFPANSEMKRELASFYVETDNYEEGVKLLNELLDEDPYSAEDWHELANHYYLTGNYEKALEACEFVLAIDPELYTVYFLIGHAYLKLENFEKALEAYLKFAEYRSDIFIVYVFIGFCYLNFEDVESAELYFEQALSMEELRDEARWELYFNLALGYSMLENTPKALEYLNQSIKDAPDRIEPYLYKGKFYMEMGDPAKAYEFFFQALKAGDFSSEAYLKVIEIYMESSEYRQALVLLKLVEEKEPHLSRVLMYFAYSYLQLKQHTEFYNYFAEMVSRYPESFHQFLKLFPDLDSTTRNMLYEVRNKILYDN